jgi:Ni/Co efflux regulator RcnB
MKKLVLAAFAATIACGAAAPAFADTVKKVVVHRDHGRHEGWRHHHGRKVVIIKKHRGHHEGSRTVIKKKVTHG